MSVTIVPIVVLIVQNSLFCSKNAIHGNNYMQIVYTFALLFM